MARRNRYNDDRDRRYSNPSMSRNSQSLERKSPIDIAKAAILASVFVIGIVVGISLNFSTNSNLDRIDSSLEIDQSAPNPELCQSFGASAIVQDVRLFITLNPFNVFVTQPAMQPGCVLRQNNWSLLEKQNLVSSEQVKDCKRRMNTFGYTGVLEGSPRISCIYQNDSVGNLFLNRPGSSGNRIESEVF